MPAISNSFTIIRDDDAVPAQIKGAVIAIGNFDGLHRGHRAVIASALAMAENGKRPVLAMTFEPHPRAFFQPQVPMFRLSSPHDKLRLMAASGLNGAVVMNFNAARAATSADDFIHRDLIARLAPSGIVIGFDFHFGKGRAGTPAMLQDRCTAAGIAVHIEPHYDWQGHPVSSSEVRKALSEGELAHANDLLGYPYFVSGSVIHGEKRGRTMGYPTANIALDPANALKHGIYAVRVAQDGVLREGVASFGRRPTFDNGAPLLEIFLFDFAGDLYGQNLDVAFIAYLRDEMRFDSLDALIAQMDRDSADARTALARQPGAFPALGDITL